MRAGKRKNFNKLGKREIRRNQFLAENKTDPIGHVEFLDLRPNR
jgi:hypothetical protein